MIETRTEELHAMVDPLKGQSAAKKFKSEQDKSAGMKDLPDELVLIVAMHASLGGFNALRRLCKRFRTAFGPAEGPFEVRFKESFEQRFASKKWSELTERLSQLYPDVDMLALLKKMGGSIAGRFVLHILTEGRVKAESVDVFAGYTVYDYKPEGLERGTFNFHSRQSMKRSVLELCCAHFGSAYRVLPEVRSSYDTIYGSLQQVQHLVCVGCQDAAVPTLRFHFSEVSYRNKMKWMVQAFEASFDRSWASADGLVIHNIYESLRRSGTMEESSFPYRCEGGMQAMLQRRLQAIEEGFLILE